MNHKIKLSTLLAVIGGIATLSSIQAAPLNVTADQSDTPDIGGVYSSTAAWNSAINIGAAGVYSGSNITATSTFGNQAHALVVAGTAVIHGFTGTTTAGSARAVRMSGTTGYLVLTDVNIVTTGSASAQGILVSEAASGISGTVFVTGGTITTHGGGWSYGVQNEGNGFVVLNNVTINTSGSNSSGISTTYGGYTEINNSVINAAGVSNGYTGINASGSSTTVVNDTQIQSSGHGITTYATAQVTLNNSSVMITGSDAALHLVSGGTVTVNGGTVATNGGDLLLVSGSLDKTVTLADVDTSGAGGITIGSAASGTTTVTVNGGSGIHGDVTNSGSGVLNLNLNGSSLTGLTSIGDNAVLTVTLDNSNWTMTGKSNLTTLSGANGSLITIASVEGEDLTVSDGITGQTKLNLTLSDGVKGQQEIHVVVDESNGMGNDAFSLDNTVSTGMQTYGLDNRTDGAWLVLGGGSGGGFTGGGDAVLNSAAGISSFWFTQMDNLNKRMGELRLNAENRKLKTESLIDNIWIRGYGQQVNLNTGISGVKGFSETQYGVDLGTDKAWSLDNHNTLHTGIFAGYGGADRDFHTGYNGSTDSGYGGLYGTWLNKDGWYADAVAKGQYFDTSFDGEGHGSYNSYGVGLSLELGRQFQFADGWFAEPSVQVSYLHLINDNYRTTQGMSVELDDADIIQFYGGARFGRNIQLNKDGWLQPYVKVGALEQISAGGKVRASGGEWRPTTDGARGVIGAGIVYQLDDRNQLHLDYEAAFGDKYDKPWGLNFGYRHQF